MCEFNRYKTQNPKLGTLEKYLLRKQGMLPMLAFVERHKSIIVEWTIFRTTVSGTGYTLTDLKLYFTSYPLLIIGDISVQRLAVTTKSTKVLWGSIV